MKAEGELAGDAFAEGMSQTISATMYARSYLPMIAVGLMPCARTVLGPDASSDDVAELAFRDAEAWQNKSLAFLVLGMKPEGSRGG